jgi:hypothetical protein
MQHDLWSLPNEEEYVKCDFDTTGGARELVPKAASCGHVVQCDTPGTKYFACNVDGACENGLQRIRLITTDSDKTAALKNQAGMSTFQTLAEVMEKELVPVAYSQDQGTALTDAKADGEWGGSGGSVGTVGSVGIGGSVGSVGTVGTVSTVGTVGTVVCTAFCRQALLSPSFPPLSPLPSLQQPFKPNWKPSSASPRHRARIGSFPPI